LQVLRGYSTHFRNLTVEIGCRGAQGLPRAVAPTGRQAGRQAKYSNEQKTVNIYTEINAF
jgi:hypothetical protein